VACVAEVLSDDAALHYYLPIDQKNAQGGGLFVRTRGPATAQVDTLGRTLQKDMRGTSYVTVTPLGDIVNSSPYYVGAPNFGYYDDFEAAPYSAFAATYRTRTPVIYMGANDGMLHAINAMAGNYGWIALNPGNMPRASNPPPKRASVITDVD